MLGISLILLDLRRIRVANLLPAIIIAPRADFVVDMRFSHQAEADRADGDQRAAPAETPPHAPP